MLDYGQSKKLPDDKRLAFARLVLAINKGDTAEVSSAMWELGIVTEKDDAALRTKMAGHMFDTQGKYVPSLNHVPILLHCGQRACRDSCLSLWQTVLQVSCRPCSVQFAAPWAVLASRITLPAPLGHTLREAFEVLLAAPHHFGLAVAKVGQRSQGIAVITVGTNLGYTKLFHLPKQCWYVLLPLMHTRCSDEAAVVMFQQTAEQAQTKTSETQHAVVFNAHHLSAGLAPSMLHAL